MDKATDEVVNKEIKVAKPEDWPAATEVRTTLTIVTLSGPPLAFNLRAMSAGELRELEASLPIPEAPVVRQARRGEEEQRDFQNPAFLEKLSSTHFSRWVVWLDKCWKPLPGNTQAEKIRWAEENLFRNGELTRIWQEARKLSGLGTGMAAASPVTETAAKEADPETWAKAGQGVRVGYKIHHETEWLVFDLAGLSQLKVNQVRDACRPPPPPMRPEMRKDPITGKRKPVPNSAEPDPTDPLYVQAVKEAELYENCLLLEAAMFPFPGSTKQEKLAWLDQRPCYEMIALANFLSGSVLSYRERIADF